MQSQSYVIYLLLYLSIHKNGTIPGYFQWIQRYPDVPDVVRNRLTVAQIHPGLMDLEKLGFIRMNDEQIELIVDSLFNAENDNGMHGDGPPRFTPPGTIPPNNNEGGGLREVLEHPILFTVDVDDFERRLANAFGIEQ